jgi:hypothetical protein
MGGESRVESGGGGGLKSTGILSLEEAGTQTVETSNIADAGDLSLTDGLTLVSGTEVDHTAGSNSYEDAYFALPTGSGYVYAEVHMYATDESNIHQAVGLIQSASIDTGAYGQTNNTAQTIRRSGTSHYRQNGSTTLVSQTVAGRSAVNTWHFLVNLDNGDVWVGLTPEGSAIRWFRSNGAMGPSWASHLPTFSGVDLNDYDHFYFQQYYTTQSAWVNFGGNPLFDGQLSSGNDSSDWFADPDASVSASSFTSGTAETLTLPQLSWGGITGRSVLTGGSGGSTPVYTFEMWGAGGGGGGTDIRLGTESGPGGAGAYVSGTLQGLTSGDIIKVFAGVPGLGGVGTVINAESAGNGGGSSSIIINTTNLAAVAGGGGGGGNTGSAGNRDATGGRGGNSVDGTSGAATDVNSGNGGNGGFSGTATAAGAVPTGGHVNSAAPTKTDLMQDGGKGNTYASSGSDAGNAYQGDNTTSTYGGTGGTGGKIHSNWGGGGGAGGGYFGGSGGGAAIGGNESGAGGGGGGSYVNSTYVASYTSAEGSFEAGAAHTGAAVNQTAGSSATAYATTNGKGGNGSNGGGNTGSAGQPGLVVLYADGVEVARADAGNEEVDVTVSGGSTPQTLVNTGIFTLEEIYELTKSA